MFGLVTDIMCVRDTLVMDNLEGQNKSQVEQSKCLAAYTWYPKEGEVTVPCRETNFMKQNENDVDRKTNLTREAETDVERLIQAQGSAAGGMFVNGLPGNNLATTKSLLGDHYATLLQIYNMDTQMELAKFAFGGNQHVSISSAILDVNVKKSEEGLPKIVLWVYIPKDKACNTVCFPSLCKFQNNVKLRFEMVGEMGCNHGTSAWKVHGKMTTKNSIQEVRALPW